VVKILTYDENKLVFGEESAEFGDGIFHVHFTAHIHLVAHVHLVVHIHDDVDVMRFVFISR